MTLPGISCDSGDSQGSLTEVNELKVLAVCGFLGYGFPEESLAGGMARQPHVVGADNGSTDPGPYYLGSGDQLTKRQQMVRDLGLSLAASRKANVPFIVGSAGTAGGDPHVDSVLDVLHDVSKRDGHSYRLAVIRAEIDKTTVKAAVRSGKVRPLGKVRELTEGDVDSATRIVGQMGVGPFVTALEGGADVIIAGRACDTAIFASMAAMKGFDLGLAYHMAKIIECGAQCAIPTGTNDCILATLRDDHFELEPISPHRRLTPTSVAAHMMYEQPAPDLFHEPEGLVDLQGVEIEQVDKRRVRVSGSRFEPAATPTIKLEGACLAGYRTIAVAGIADPNLIDRLDRVESDVRGTVDSTLRNAGVGDYDLRFIAYGRDGVLMAPNARADRPPHEVGLVLEAIARDQETADAILSLARSTFLHSGFEGRKATGGNLAFPFSPSDFRGGPVFEFNVYHLMEVDDPSAPFSVEFEDIRNRHLVPT